MTQPAVLVLFNEPVLPAGHPDALSELDVLDTVADTVKVLRNAGFAVRQLGIDYDPRPLLDELKSNPPDAVFNLFEGVATRTGTEIAVAALLEWLNIPFTGCQSLSLALGRDKIRTKHLLKAVGLPNAEYLVIEHLPVPAWNGSWPAIVKPALQDASVGIDQGSVVSDQDQLNDRVRYVFGTYGGPVLIEQFLSGREFHIHVIEEKIGDANEIKVLPLAEIVYQKTDKMKWQVYTFTAKWHTESDEYKACPLIAPVELPAEQTAILTDLSIRAFRLMDCRDYARLDVRMSAEGMFHILEMNPNPYLNSIALVKGLEAVGSTHERFVIEMTLNVMARGGKHFPPGTVKIPIDVAAK
jgi:D-alanine-D-alanine ligase